MSCDQGANTCAIRVPAPGAALVFFSDAAQAAADSTSGPTTFATSVVTQRNTATIDRAVLATSNGQSGKMRVGHMGKTSDGAVSEAGVKGLVIPSLSVHLLGAVVSILAMLW